MDSGDTFERDEHGGDLAEAERRFGPPPVPGWLDLSTGINPSPYPQTGIAAESLARLPDRRAMARLLSAARGYYRIPGGAEIVAAPGTQALIQVLPRLIGGERVSITGPTYGEHELAWRRAGRDIVDGPADIAVIVHPNNPDGRLWADLPSARTVVVDEAFCDTLPDATFAGAAASAGVVILKSFGKFFGLGGLRLGFAICAPGFAAKLRVELGPWAVSGPALEIGERALADERWVADTRTRLTADRAKLDRILVANGLGVLGGTDLFRFAQIANADALRGHLGRTGILVRGFAAMPDRLRFGLPYGTDQFVRLEAALAAYARSSK